MRRYNLINALFIVLLFITFGCADTSKTNEDVISETGRFIQITQKQFASDNMEIGEVTIQNFKDEVKCNGYITAPPNGMAQISTQISGIVETINCSFGDYVKKGDILCMLSTNELFVLQQNFIETSAILKRLKADYERSKALFNEKIGAEKDLISIESEYEAMMAKHQSLKLRLELLKLNVSKIEAGELYAAFPVIAPINGHITSLNIVLGQFIELHKTLIEIVDVNQLQLQLSVFENDIKKLKPGQRIQFNSMGETDSLHYAILFSTGKTINMESMTIQCIAKIENKDKVMFINHSYIEAAIIVNQREANALPNDAISKAGQDNFIFVVEKSDNQIYYLRKVKVNIGCVSKGFSEIINGDALTKIITKGVYNLHTE
ncbi:MAG: efflux RND transporter periplasmic adaptor subunit [Bacteroidales bacterium]|nr:efflux RND transporter periplasmic adaptor subunit [Bacteroidales bacterium]